MPIYLQMQTLKGRRLEADAVLLTNQVIGRDSSIFCGYETEQLFIDYIHAELIKNQHHYNLKNLSRQFSLVVNGDKLNCLDSKEIRSGDIISIGLCTFEVSIKNNAEEFDYFADLERSVSGAILKETSPELTSEMSVNISLDNILIEDAISQEIIELENIEKLNLETAKEEWDDFNLGSQFDEVSFFRDLEISKPHGLASELYEIDILDRLAIESEIAIKNPGRLSLSKLYETKSIDEQRQILPPLEELQGLLKGSVSKLGENIDMENNSKLCSLLIRDQEINALLQPESKNNIFIQQPDFLDVLYQKEESVDPLRLFSIQENLSRFASKVIQTPSFTEKEHHSASMDAHFSPTQIKQDLFSNKKPTSSVNDLIDLGIVDSLSGKPTLSPEEELLHALNPDLKSNLEAENRSSSLDKRPDSDNSMNSDTDDILNFF